MDWPKVLLFLALGVLVVTAVRVIAGSRLLAREKADPAIYADLRSRVLTASAVDLGVPLPSDDATPFGVIMDWAVGQGTATLVAWSSGDTSVYLSSGGGVIGGYAIEEANHAAKALVARAAQFADGMEPTTEFPLPATGQVRFYLRTRAGVLTANGPENDLGGDRHRLAPLFYASQEVITALRTAQR